MALNSLQTNAETLKRQREGSLKMTGALDETREFLARIGVNVRDNLWLIITPCYILSLHRTKIRCSPLTLTS